MSDTAVVRDANPHVQQGTVFCAVAVSDKAPAFSESLELMIQPGTQAKA